MGRAGLRRPPGPAAALAGEPGQPDRGAGRAGPPGDRQAGRRGDRGVGRRDRPCGVGGQARAVGARAAAGGQHADADRVRLAPGVPAVRGDRGDRPVELSGADPAGLHRVRAGRRERRRRQAQRVHPGRGRLARGALRRGGAGAAGTPDRLRGRGHRRGAVPLGRGQAGLHRFHRDREEGDGRVRADPHAGAAGVRRQGRDGGRCRRRPRPGRRGRRLGRPDQRGPDVCRH